MNKFWSENECQILTHSQQQSQAPKTHKKELTVRLTTRITILCPPPQGLSFTGLRTQLKSSARHTLSNQQAQPKEAETFNLTEYDVRYIFKATKQGALKVTLHHFLLLGNSKHHTQHDIINSTATSAPFTLIMLHS